jgi:hypothetical protein
MKPEYVFYVNVGRRSYNAAKRHLDEIRDQMDDIFGEGRVLVLERRGDSVIKVLNPNKSNRPWSLFCSLLAESNLLSRVDKRASDQEVQSMAEISFIATDLFEQVEEKMAKETDMKRMAEHAASVVEEKEAS